jgi:ubiquinone/menaquinone biosynthesis C-methylase UbiE
MIAAKRPPASVQTAYDQIADDYDRQVAGDRWMRERLWQRYAERFAPGAQVLDVACGTGIDAVYLAHRGVQVTAIDISPEMIVRCRARAKYAQLDQLIDARVLNLADLGQLPSNGFDGVVSAFAGLNTAPDLARVASDAARLLRPNGRFIVHMLNRVSLWEWLSLAGHGRFGAARSLGRNPQRTFEIGGQPVVHTLDFPLATYQNIFAADFRLEHACALGVLRPPHDLHWIPERLVGRLGSLEEHLGARRPWLNRGRFFVLELVKRSSDDVPV